jgi:rsbT co-antagonist protein RsbR
MPGQSYNPMSPKTPGLRTRLRQWLGTLPYQNPVEQRQAVLIQSLLLAMLVLSTVGSFVTLLAPIALVDALAVIAIIWLGVPIALAGLWLLHSGRFNAAIMLSCVGLILLLSLLLIATGARDGGAAIFGFALPIMLAGLMADWRTTALSIFLSGTGILTAMILERMHMPLVGIAAPQGENIGGILGGFLVIACILGVFVMRFGQVLHNALDEAQQRAQKLDQLHASLERSIAERTAELRTTLAELQTRTTAQARLLDENAAQRSAIQLLSVPVLPVSARTLVIPLVGALDSQRLQMLQERALNAIEHSSARRVLLDVSAVPLIDTQVAQGLLDVVRQLYLLGAQAALVGVRPEVAQSLVALGVELTSVRTYRDLEAALHAEQ